MSETTHTNTTGPNGCDAVLNITGEHFWCEESAPHPGLAHVNAAAEAIWTGAGEVAENQAAWATSGAEESGR